MTTYSKSQPEPDCWGIAMFDDDGRFLGSLPFYNEEARDEAFDILQAEEVNA